MQPEAKQPGKRISAVRKRGACPRQASPEWHVSRLGRRLRRLALEKAIAPSSGMAWPFRPLEKVRCQLSCSFPCYRKSEMPAWVIRFHALEKVRCPHGLFVSVNLMSGAGFAWLALEQTIATSSGIAGPCALSEKVRRLLCSVVLFSTPTK